jgi:hypothetical protein
VFVAQQQLPRSSAGSNSGASCPPGARFVAAFGRITDPKVRRGIARLANRIADGMQPKASAELLQFKEPTDAPADNT